MWILRAVRAISFRVWQKTVGLDILQCTIYSWRKQCLKCHWDFRMQRTDELWRVVNFCAKLGKSASEMLAILKEAYRKLLSQKLKFPGCIKSSESHIDHEQHAGLPSNLRLSNKAVKTERLWTIIVGWILIAKTLGLPLRTKYVMWHLESILCSRKNSMSSL